MSLWHHRIINPQQPVPDIKIEGSPLPFYKAYSTDKSVILASFFTSYPSAYLHQQNSDSTKKNFVAIDGRIDNIAELSQDLGISTNTLLGDLLIHLYQRHGSKGISHLKGSFSLVLYDTAKELTLLYRSFLKGHPLYFVAKNNLLTVATNPVYLFHRSDVSDTLNSLAIYSIFSLDFSKWQDCIFQELTALKQGEMVIISPSNIHHYEKPLNELFPPIDYSSDKHVIEKYRHLVESAVHTALLPNSQHGIMLSSGIDSGTLAVFASQKLHKQNRQLTAYSWTLPEDTLGDESEKIKSLCQKLQMPLKLFDGSPFGPFDSLDDLFLLPDTPFTNPFWPITAELYRHASKDGINVLLNGNYADLLFPGSRNRFTDIHTDKLFALFFPTLQSIIKQVGYHNLKKSPAFRGLISYFLPRRKKPDFHPSVWLSDAAKESQILFYSQNIESVIQKGFEHFTTALSPFQSGSLSLERYLSGQYGIERIEPHRNIELLNYSLGIPTYLTYRHGQMKFFAREAMRGFLPESIRIQPRVGDLTLLVNNSYLRNKQMIKERLLDDRSVWKQYVNEKWMQKILNATTALSYSDILVIWTSLNMQQWQNAIKPGGSLYKLRESDKLY